VTRHYYDCHVRFSDVDVYGHVNNVKYFEYYQEARIAFVGSLGHGPDEPALGIVLARIDVDYKRPILFRSDPYLVESRVTRVGTSSFDLAAEIRDGDQVLSRAEAVLVSYDLGRRSSRALTEKERERLSAVLES
jgi:acyl-CoA thioester hydrolase